MASEAKTKRTFSGFTDRGEPFAIFYTSSGVKWLRGDEARPFVREAPDRPPAAGRSASGTAGMSILAGLDAVSDGLGAIAQLAQAVAAVGMWTEARQDRILDQAKFEEERRIPWLADMMHRWLIAHRDEPQLDLRISAFLAREAKTTMSALVDNKRMALPQSMLYDLDLIREAVSSARVLLLAQFDQLTTHSAYDLDRAVRQAVPDARGLDTAFIQRLAADPQEDWSQWLRDRSSRPFDDDLREVLRHRDDFLSRLFDVREPIALETRRGRPLLQRMWERVSTIPSSFSGLGDLGKDVAVARRDDFRELMLLSAEITRASALHSAWGVIDSVVRQDVGSGIVIGEQYGQLFLSTGQDAQARQVLQPAPRAELEAARSS